MRFGLSEACLQAGLGRPPGRPNTARLEGRAAWRLVNRLDVDDFSTDLDLGTIRNGSGSKEARPPAQLLVSGAGTG